MNKIARACGSWPSPVSAAMCAEKPDGSWGGAMFEPQTDGQSLYWLSARPSQEGRTALMRWDLEGEACEILPAPWNVRSGVFEYGGGAYIVRDNTIWFSQFADGRIYRQSPGAKPVPVTPENQCRYADFAFDAARGRLIAVRENFDGVGQARDEEAHEIVAIDLDTGLETILVSGADFVSSPRLTADATQLAWLAWDHPNMPWDAVRLCRASVAADGELTDIARLATEIEQAPIQPLWSPNGELYYISDSDGWWNLHHWPQAESGGRQVSRIEAEIGMPGWYLGWRHWDFIDAHRVAVLYQKDFFWHAATLDLASGELSGVTAAQATLASLTIVEGRVFVTGSDQSGGGGLYEYCAGDLIPILSGDPRPDIGEISVAQALQVSLPASKETKAGEVCYAWYYPPANRDFQPLPDEKPPVIVQFHGGPTAASYSAFSLNRQFWTSRGFALLDVNYRGSLGQGRAFRHRLYGSWGISDVEDAVATLKHAADLGLVDPARAAISGGSAGGFTTLAALAFHDAFQVGVNLFGISDLVVFCNTTHKFESRYLKTLVCGWTHDEKTLVERSPITALDHIDVPLMTLQGEIDKIVPPSQSHIVMDAVREKGIPCAYIEFEDEGHGFRKRDTLIRTLEASLSFYGQILGFELAGEIVPVAIDNFPHLEG